MNYSNIKKLFNIFVFSKKIHYFCIGGEQTQDGRKEHALFFKKSMDVISSINLPFFLASVPSSVRHNKDTYKFDKNQLFILIYTFSYSVRKVTSAQISPLAQISLSNVKSKME